MSIRILWAMRGLCREFLSRVTLGYDRRQRSWRTSAMIDFKGSHFERNVILWGVRWYVAYPMSYRQLEEMMEERGVEVDHSTHAQSLGRQVCVFTG
jgi:hypothetical protein